MRRLAIMCVDDAAAVPIFACRVFFVLCNFSPALSFALSFALSLALIPKRFPQWAQLG